MKAVLVACVALLVAGCQTTTPAGPVLRSTKYVVPDIPPEFLRCDQVTYPDYHKLTDVQVARLLVSLDRNNRECARNIAAIQQFLTEARRLTQ